MALKFPHFRSILIHRRWNSYHSVTTPILQSCEEQVPLWNVVAQQQRMLFIFSPPKANSSIRVIRQKNSSSLVSNRIDQKRCFSSETKPFSRKKAAKKTDAVEEDYKLLLAFNVQATVAMITIAKAVAPVVEMNPGFTLTSNFDLKMDAFQLALEKEAVQLELNTNSKGSYMFTICRKERCLNLVSPMSGMHSYLYDEGDKLWLSASDRHDLRGMVTRDLLRHARGLAQF